MAQSTLLNPDFRDLLRLLNESGADYLVVGAYALAAHGMPRATGDLDIFLRPDPSNAAKVLRALSEFGFGDVDLSVEDLSKPNSIVRLGVPPRQVDFITEISGVSFEEAWKTLEQVDMGDGLVARVLGLDALERNKQSAGRLKDLADLDVLRRERNSRAE